MWFLLGAVLMAPLATYPFIIPSFFPTQKPAASSYITPFGRTVYLFDMGTDGVVFMQPGGETWNVALGSFFHWRDPKMISADFRLLYTSNRGRMRDSVKTKRIETLTGRVTPTSIEWENAVVWSRSETSPAPDFPPHPDAEHEDGVYGRLATSGGFPREVKGEWDDAAGVESPRWPRLWDAILCALDASNVEKAGTVLQSSVLPGGDWDAWDRAIDLTVILIVVFYLSALAGLATCCYVRRARTIAHVPIVDPLPVTLVVEGRDP